MLRAKKANANRPVATLNTPGGMGVMNKPAVAPTSPDIAKSAMPTSAVTAGVGARSALPLTEGMAPSLLNRPPNAQ